MSCCSSCAQGLPCESARVAGVLFCDVDRSAFYSQTVPLYPNQFQRWLVVMDKPEGELSPAALKLLVVQWLNDVGVKAGLSTSMATTNYRAVKVLGVSDKRPNAALLADSSRVVKVVSPLPKIHQNPFSSEERTNLLYVALEFYYDGARTSGPWPWNARGFAVKCPEDALSGLIAVMKPLSALPPPTLLQELEQPLQQAAIKMDEAITPVLRDIKEKAVAPVKAVTSALEMLLWGSTAVLLFNLFKRTSSAQRG